MQMQALAGLLAGALGGAVLTGEMRIVAAASELVIKELLAVISQPLFCRRWRTRWPARWGGLC